MATLLECTLRILDVLGETEEAQRFLEEEAARSEALARAKAKSYRALSLAPEEPHSASPARPHSASAIPQGKTFATEAEAL